MYTAEISYGVTRRHATTVCHQNNKCQAQFFCVVLFIAVKGTAAVEPKRRKSAKQLKRFIIWVYQYIDVWKALFKPGSYFLRMLRAMRISLQGKWENERVPIVASPKFALHSHSQEV